MNVAEALVSSRFRAIRCLSGRGKPALIDAAAVAAKGVQVVRVEPQTAPRNHERTRHPARLQPENSATRINRFLNVRSIHHAGSHPPKVYLPRNAFLATKVRSLSHLATGRTSNLFARATVQPTAKPP